MAGFFRLLRENRNYRYTWFGQVVSEFGDHFNNIAVFSLALANTKSGIVVSGNHAVARSADADGGTARGGNLSIDGPRRVMIASDIVRGVVALAFILAIPRSSTMWLYPLSAMLMFASPFFTSGRSAILPAIATREELHTANTLTQTTQWTTLTLGGFFAGIAVKQFGYEWAFVLNSLSFFFSAWCISQLRVPGGTLRRTLTNPLPKSIGCVPGASTAKVSDTCGRSRCCSPCAGRMWMGHRRRRGADSVRTVRRERFQGAPVGIGTIWSPRARAGRRRFDRALARTSSSAFSAYKRTISICYLIHGAAYVMFSQMEKFGWPCCSLRSRVLRRGQLGAEHDATAFTCRRRVPRPCVRHAGDIHLGHDDAVDDGRRRSFGALQPSYDRGMGGSAQFNDGVLLGAR